MYAYSVRDREEIGLCFKYLRERQAAVLADYYLPRLRSIIALSNIYTEEERNRIALREVVNYRFDCIVIGHLKTTRISNILARLKEKYMTKLEDWPSVWRAFRCTIGRIVLHL